MRAKLGQIPYHGHPQGGKEGQLPPWILKIKIFKMKKYALSRLFLRGGMGRGGRKSGSIREVPLTVFSFYVLFLYAKFSYHSTIFQDFHAAILAHV